jgi:hypothetical protein
MVLSTPTPELSQLWARYRVDNSGAKESNKYEDADSRDKPSMNKLALSQLKNDEAMSFVSDPDKSDGFLSSKRPFSQKALTLTANIGAKSILPTEGDLQANNHTISVFKDTFSTTESTIQSAVAHPAENQVRSNVQSAATMPPTANSVILNPIPIHIRERSVREAILSPISNSDHSTLSTTTPLMTEGQKKRAGSPTLDGESTVKKFKTLQEELAMQKAERLEKEKMAREAQERLKLKIDALEAEVAKEASLTKLAQEKIDDCEDIEKSLC